MTQGTKSTELNPLSFLKRELSKEERKQRGFEIEDYLLSKGGVIVAISCKDGILLTGASPGDDPTIFDVFDRIGLLGIGSIRDCEAIHSLATGRAYGTMLMPSKADIDSRNIAKQISNEIDERFRYTGSQRGPYKANFVIAELGFDREEDFIELINYFGGNEILSVPRRKFWKIYEVPTVFKFLVPEEQSEETWNFIQANPNIEPEEVKNFVQANRKAEKKNDKEGKSKGKMYEFKLYRVPMVDAFDCLFNGLYSDGNIPTVQEAALFVGLLIRLFNERGGRLEVIYLDRNMLKKTKTEGRRFHYILNRITNSDPRKPSDSWQAWRKFVAPAYTKVKRGELYPEQKFIIDIFEDLEKKGFDKKDELKKMKKQELAKLVVDLLGKKQQENQ